MAPSLSGGAAGASCPPGYFVAGQPEQGADALSGRGNATCIDGANASPPEDVGGAPGYADFLDALADPEHPEYLDMLDWYGDTFDPTAFDRDDINQRLKRIKV